MAGWRLAAMLSALALVGPAAGVAAPAGGPSFDCSRATSPIEKGICADPGTTAYDRDLAALYARTLAGLRDDADKAALRQSQRDWMKRRDAACLTPPKGLTIGQCLGPVYSARQAELHDWGLASLSVAMMPDGALDAAYGAGRASINVESAIYSNDGTLLALAIGGSHPEAIWLYDVAARRLVSATPVPPRGTDATVERFYWVGHALYIEGQRGATGAAPQRFRLAADMAGARPVAAMPAPEARPGAPRDVTRPDPDGGERNEEAGRFSVASQNEGHGAFVLTGGASGAGEWTIERGGAGLSGFVFDAPRARVLYHGNSGGLVLYDLQRRRKTAYALPVDDILAVSPDGTTTAFTASGACSGKRSTSTEPTRVCFARLP